MYCSFLICMLHIVVKPAIGPSGEAVGPADASAAKKIIKVTPKRTPQGMQAQLMCNYCNYTSPKRYLLTRHMKTHSEVNLKYFL